MLLSSSSLPSSSSTLRLYATAKADVLDDMTKRVKKKPPKQNIMGEVILRIYIFAVAADTTLICVL